MSVQSEDSRQSCLVVSFTQDKKFLFFGKYWSLSIILGMEGVTKKYSHLLWLHIAVFMPQILEGRIALRKYGSFLCCLSLLHLIYLFLFICCYFPLLIGGYTSNSKMLKVYIDDLIYIVKFPHPLINTFIHSFILVKTLMFCSLSKSQLYNTVLSNIF